MRKLSNILLLLALVANVAWAFATPQYRNDSAQDLKTTGLGLDVEDISGAALAALDAAAPGVGVPCTGFGDARLAGPYPCQNVDLLGLVSLAEMGGAAGNDSWGWTSPDGGEYVLAGTGRGTALIDVSDPTSPAVIGIVANAGGDADEGDGALWRDIKVNNDHAYIVSERGGGLQIVDLIAAVDNAGTSATSIDFDLALGGQGEFRFDGFHNVVINEETDTLFLVGVDSFNGRGMILTDISDPTNPVITGDFEHGLTVHDATCVIYRGADTDYNGNYDRDGDGIPGPLDADGDSSNGFQAEICFTFDEDVVNFVDVTMNAEPIILNTVAHNEGIVRNGEGTPGANNGVTGVYAHQGWLTEDHQFLIYGDELDELNTRFGATTGGTSTYYLELTDLDAKDELGHYTGAPVNVFAHPTSLATDHNLYVAGDLLFQANYAEGVRVLRITSEALRNGYGFDEVGFFDVAPGVNAPGFAGTWNVYPFFDSGTIVASSLDQGVFTLQFNDPADASGALALN